MELSRREFLKASGVGVGGIFLFQSLDPNAVLAKTRVLPLKKVNGWKRTWIPATTFCR